MTTHPTPELLRHLADQIEAGNTEFVEVNMSTRPSAEKVGEMRVNQLVYRITVTTPPSLAALGMEPVPLSELRRIAGETGDQT